MNVLSLFDGISCGQIALNRSGIIYNKYYASEINSGSIKITQKNYPNTIQLGNVCDIDGSGLPKINLLIGGSPCQNLSIININNSLHNQGLGGEKSKLFYEYIRIKNKINPDYFLLENVASMSDNDRDIITEVLGVEPIMIDSCLLSAQDRKRYYWTNIPGIEQPKDKGILLRDILEDNVSEKYYYKQPFILHDESKKVIATIDLKTHDLLRRVYNPNNKCATLTAISGGYQHKKVLQNGRVRRLTPLEYERLQTLPEGYTEGISETERYSGIGNGWTADVIAHIFKYIKL